MNEAIKPGPVLPLTEQERIDATLVKIQALGGEPPLPTPEERIQWLKDDVESRPTYYDIDCTG
jgi:hypothetical protein